jgi:hypothetical protein
MTTSDNPVRFLQWFAAVFLAALVGVTGFVLLVDPYGLYGFVNRQGVNQVKPRLTRHQQEVKLDQAVGMGAEHLILGNSRAEIGLDPDAPAFKERMPGQVYNLAVPGTGISVGRRQVEYMRQAGIAPKTLVIGLEFLDFLSHGKSPASGPRSDGWVREYAWRFDMLFSLSSVKDALQTLRIQHDPEAESVSPKGLNPLNEYQKHARNEGYYAVFKQKSYENAKTYLKKASEASLVKDFTHVRAILDMAAESGSEVQLVIYPYHAQIMFMFEETGLWSAFAEWKKALATEVENARKVNPALTVSLTDFSGFSKLQCEVIPRKGDRTANTRWYWEAGHFKKELGDVMLARLFNVDSPSVSGFGFVLGAENLADNEKRIAMERVECLANYPELFTETKATVAQVRNKNLRTSAGPQEM